MMEECSVKHVPGGGGEHSDWARAGSRSAAAGCRVRATAAAGQDYAADGYRKDEYVAGGSTVNKGKFEAGGE